ncbi:MAG TPA: hypothetical protein VGH14_12555 [Solirubrobacterales bacterium]|jgi:hypothetical protein
MDPIEKRELKRQAWRRLSAQRRRAGLLRGRVVAISLICFALLWGIVFVQMATGNDPVLSAKEKTGRTTASAGRHRETTHPREGGGHKAKAREEEATVEEEPVIDEEPEAEFIGPEVEEVEAEPEFVEEEPLVTSQS